MGTVRDLRRPDLRTGVLANPYWITSADIDVNCDDQDAVLFSFPIVGIEGPSYGNTVILIHAIFFEVTAVYDGTSDMLIGTGHLLTDDVTTSGTIDDEDVDEYFQSAEIDLTTKGWYTPATGDIVALWAAAAWAEWASITCIDDDVVCIEAQLTGTSPTTGGGRVHALISVIPSVG